jgi:hypothetical protein
MPKQLFQPCADIQFLGMRVHQYQTTQDHKWFLFLELQGLLLDPAGNTLPATNDIASRVQIAGPLDEALTLPQIVDQLSGVMGTLKTRLIQKKIEYADRTDAELLAEGFTQAEIDAAK